MSFGKELLRVKLPGFLTRFGRNNCNRGPKPGSAGWRNRWQETAKAVIVLCVNLYAAAQVVVGLGGIEMRVTSQIITMPNIDHGIRHRVTQQI